MIQNPQTGEQIEFLVETPDLLTMRSTWTRPGHRAVEHVHPQMEETFEVIDGDAMFRVGGREGQEHELAAGDRLTVTAGTPHLGWNATASPVTLLIHMRPSLRWAEFTTRLFAGDDLQGLLIEYSAEIQAPR